MKPDAQSLLEATLSTLSALVPGMIGAAVGQFWKPGLSWRQRVLQWIVGVSCQYYVSQAVVHGLSWHPFVAQSLGFFVAMCAFEVAPRLVKAVGDATATLPDIVKQAASDLLARFRTPGGPA